MAAFEYNDLQFSLEARAGRWDLYRRRADGAPAIVGTGLFAGLSEEAARERAMRLARTIFPCGVRLVAPDLAHPRRVGQLRIVGPDVGHPSFVAWNKDTCHF